MSDSKEEIARALRDVLPGRMWRDDEPIDADYIAQAGVVLEMIAALRAERDESAKSERERIARKFDARAEECRKAMLETVNVGVLFDLSRAKEWWTVCAAMAREEAK